MRLHHVLAFSVVAACMEPADELPFEGDATDDAKADAATLTFTDVAADISSSRLADGGTYVLRSKSAWKHAMGTTAPASVDFSTEWVVFYGAGVRNTGGYTAKVTGLSYSASKRSLIVSTHESSPDADCIVTQALTSPHHVVKVQIPSPRPLSALADHSDDVRSCSEAREIISYWYGNQISGSELTIMSDGTINHKERRTPTNIETITHAKLSATKLAELTGWIEAAPSGTLVESDGTETNLGSSSGSLKAFTPSGAEVVIETDARDGDGDGYNDLTINDSVAAMSIRTMIVNLVDRDLP
jgi:hypothetical protein